MASSMCVVMGSMDPFFKRQHSVTISPLKCSPPLRLHPKFKSVREETDSWLHSITRPDTAKATTAVLQAQVPLLICSAYAHAQDERKCSAIAKYLAWTCMIDDILDVPESDRAASKSQEAELKVVLDHAEASVGGQQSLTNDSRLEQFLDRSMDTAEMQWWKEMKDLGMSPLMQKRFVNALAMSLHEQAESLKRELQVEGVPNMETYVELRRNAAAGVPVLFLFCEWCAGAEINEDMERNSILGELHLAVNDYICWINDLFSLKREYCNGDLRNLPSVICNQLLQAPMGCPDDHLFQKSVDIVHHMVCMRDHDYARLLREAYSTPSLMATPGMSLYLEGLGNWMSGGLLWYYTSSRFHGLELSGSHSVHAPLDFLLSPPPN